MIKTFTLLAFISLLTLNAFSSSITSEPEVADLDTNSITISWSTDDALYSGIAWGYTSDLEQDTIVSSTSGTEHRMEIENLEPSTLIYMLAFSYSGSDTVKADDVILGMTASKSSGDIKVYFVSTVDTSVAITEMALQVEDAIADTLVNYINRAAHTIDMAIYNLDTYNDSEIATALNNAYNRGVTIRVVYNESTANYGIAKLNSGIGKIESPSDSDYGIMHNKFVVFDVNSVDSAIVWTGSTNFTSQQLNTDANDVIILQDQSLAKAYTIEFNEMFGSETATPNESAAKFGFDKEDNTPHDFIIGGKKVESYFSPSDNTESHIIDVINSAENELHIATMLITRADIANAIEDAYDAGADTKIIMDDIDSYTQDNILVNALGADFRTMGESGTMHHKYMIVDHSSNDSDPQVLTGCHNWSSAANNKNDENTLIVHDQTIANLYYQEFVNRFANGEIVAAEPMCLADTFYYTEEDYADITISVTDNDSLVGDVSMEIASESGQAVITINSDNSITYRPKIGFTEGIDTFRYQFCSDEYYGLCGDALVTIYVGDQTNAVSSITASSNTKIYPNVSGGVYTFTSDQDMQKVSVINAAGQVVYTQDVSMIFSALSEYEIDLSDQPEGMYYFIALGEGDQYFTQTIILQH